MGVGLTLTESSSSSSGLASVDVEGKGKPGECSARGVVTDPFDSRRSVKERVDVLCGIGGAACVFSSLASSKDSWKHGTATVSQKI